MTRAFDRFVRPALMAGAGLAALCLASACQPQAAAPTAAELAAQAEATQTAFDTLVEEITTASFRRTPEGATYLGLPTDVMGGVYNNRLDMRGPEADAAALADARAHLARVMAVDVSQLTQQQKLTHAVLVRGFEQTIAGFDHSPWYGNGLYAVSQLSGLHINLPNLMTSQQPLSNAEDAANYVARLNAFGGAFDQTLETIAVEQAAGVIPPKFILEKTIAVIDAFIAAPTTENTLYTHLATKLAEAGIPEADNYLFQANMVLEQVVYPSYRRLKAALEAQLPLAPAQQGLSDLPNGAAAYQLAIATNADTTQTAEQIHAYGLSEVTRIQAEMDAIFQSQGMTEGTVGDRVKTISEDPQFRYPDTDEGKAQLIADLNAQMAEIAPMLPQYFGTIPPQPVEIRRVPLFSEASAPGGYYDLPSLDGTRPGIYWINLKTTATWPKWSLKTLTYHEASPGHHYQIALSLAVEGVPLLRKLSGTTTAFAEGWALYVEKVAAKDMGLYANDPFGDIGRLQAELFRAVRLVVDTGLHAKGWSREQAIEFMVSSGAADPIEAEREIERYVVWPGQALGYKMGMAEMERLRAMAEAELGDKFNLPGFHDALVIDGGLPIPILESRVREWIDRTKAG